MNISEICIKRPVLACVLSLIIISLGVIYFFKLQIRGTPDIDQPIISIRASYPGADAEFMESAITTLIEKNIRNVKKLDTLSSSSSQGSAQITAVFKLGADLEVALNDIRSRVSDISNNFPKDMTAPQVEKFDSDAWPTLWISISSQIYNEMELTEIVTEFIKKPLEKLDAVGEVMIIGSKRYTVFVEPTPKKLLAYNISPLEIEMAVRNQNQDYPAGVIKTDVRDFYLNLKSPKKTVEEFKSIILKEQDSELIKISDIANVKLAPEENHSIIKFNGEKSIALGVIKQSNSNIIQMSDAVIAELEALKATLPKGINLNIAYDGAVPVKESVKSVFLTIFEALILVTLVIYLFLASFRITIIPFVTIPISLIGTLSFMYWCNFSINTFTLLAMILAIGLVVDDAIVMLENIYRYVEQEKLSPYQAALKGSKEIMFALIAMTITLASVFLPIGFIEGFVGKLFIEFAWTLAFSVLISGFVALSLTPMMASRMIKNTHINNNFYFLEAFQRFLISISQLYITLLRYIFKNRIKFFLFCFIQVIIIILCFKYVRKEFTPEEDYSVLQVVFNGPEGSTSYHTDKFVKQAEQIFHDTKEIDGYLTIVGWGGGEKGFGFIGLKPWDKRDRSQFQIKDELNARLSMLTGVSAFAMSPRPMGGGGNSKAVEFNILSTKDIHDLVIDAKAFVEQMRSNSAFQDVEMDVKTSSPTVEISVNKDKAYLLGAGMDAIGKTIQYLQGGVKIGDYKQGNEVYDIRLQYSSENRSSITDLSKLYIKNDAGKMIFLDNVANIEEKITIKSINHYNGLNAVGISANLGNGATSAQAASLIKETAGTVIDAKTSKIEFTGELKRLGEANYQMLLTFLFALLFIYLVLSAQFESFKDPLLILLAVPFSITGGVALIYLTGNSLNLYSNIGLVTLIGLITKNSIMIVEFANQLMVQGKKVNEAILEAAKLRLRPILMTTIATICGAVPLVFASGADANARHSIGYVIIGGMSVGTLFTLFVIPLLYRFFKKDIYKSVEELALE